QVVTQEVLDQVIERLSQQSMSGSGGGISGDAWAWLSILTSGKKAGQKLAKKVQREALKQVKADLRLGKSNPLLPELEASASHMEEKELGKLGLEMSVGDVDPSVARTYRFIDEQRAKSLKELERQDQKVLEKEELKLEKEKHPGDKATKNRGTSTRRVNPYLDQVKIRNPITPVEKEARNKLAKDLEEQCM